MSHLPGLCFIPSVSRHPDLAHSGQWDMLGGSCDDGDGDNEEDRHQFF